MSLTRQSVNAVKWSAIGNMARYGLQLGAQIVLARLLGAENYGLFALGMIVMALSGVLANFGLGWSLVQAQDLSEKDVRFVFTWQLISGTVAAISLYLLAPAIASFFTEPRMESIVKWLSLGCVITAATSPASNLLRRKLDFKSLNLIEVSSYLIGYVVIGVPFAYNGAGVWSLVAAWLSQALCSLLLSFIRCPHTIKPLLWYKGASAVTGIGFAVFVTNICNWLLNNLDRTLLGRLLSAQTVGLYTVGYNLANTPNMLFLNALQPAFLAAGARIQSESIRLRSTYLSVLATIWIVILPMFVLFAVIAEDLVGLLYGPAWASTGIVLAILALSMPASITWGLSTPILWNTGRKYWESLLQLPILVASGFALFTFANKGVVMVAIVAACTLLARAIVITSAACHQLKIGPRDLFGFAIRGFAMAFLAAAGTFAGAEVGHVVGASHFYALLGGVFFGGSALIAAPLMYPRILGAPVIQMLGRFSPPLFTFLDRRLRSSSIRGYALLGGLLIGVSVLIAVPIMYPQTLEAPVIKTLVRFNSSVIVFFDTRLRSTFTKDEGDK